METSNQSFPQVGTSQVPLGANDHFVKYGGVHFRNNVSPEEINNFVRKLPAGKRDSLFEVLEQLELKGLITIVNDHTFADGNHVIGGGDPGSDKAKTI